MQINHSASTQEIPPQTKRPANQFPPVYKWGFWLRVGALALVSCGLTATTTLAADNDDQDSEFRYTVFPYWKIADGLTGFNYLGYVDNTDKDYDSYYFGLGVNWQPKPWLQVWAGAISLYTDNETKADQLEIRPFIGPKLFLPNDWDWNIYNFTRYEYRTTENLDTKDWSDTNRLRTRFGVEIPLTSKEKAWNPHTTYLIADAEPYYTFEKGQIDPFRLRAGLGYVINDRMRVEFIYHAEFTRPNGGSLEHTNNIFRLNFKIGVQRGLLKTLLNPSAD